MNEPSAHVELGRRVRQLRSDRHLTLKQLEQACGLSATHLSEIERGRTSPTLGALARIAQALERDASYFVEDRELRDASHLPREQAPAFLAAGGRVEALTHGVPGGNLFAYRLHVVGPGFLLPVGEGEALYLVRRGRVEAEFAGGCVALGPGDSVQGRRNVPHALRAPGGPAEVVAVFTRRLEEPT